jgi:hypothetical protein
MSARFTKLSHPIQTPTAGEGISVMLAIFAGVMVLIIFGAFLSTFVRPV